MFVHLSACLTSELIGLQYACYLVPKLKLVYTPSKEP